jgi:hypothetical protein
MKIINIMKNIMNVLIKPKEQSNEFQTTWEDDYIGDTEYDDVLECGCCACCGCTCLEDVHIREDLVEDLEEEFIDDYERQNEQAKEFMKMLRSK